MSLQCGQSAERGCIASHRAFAACVATTDPAFSAELRDRQGCARLLGHCDMRGSTGGFRMATVVVPATLARLLPERTAT